MRDVAQTTTIDYYNDDALNYFRSTYQVTIPKLWDKLIEQRNGSLVLDIGCGSGRDLHYFSRKGYKVVGVDISFNLIKLAHEHSKQPVVLADMCTLPFKKSFHAAWAIGSLLHIHRSSIVRALSEIHRALNKGAILVSSLKKGFGSATDHKGRYFTYYQQDEWSNVLTQAKFELVSIEEMVETRGTERIEWIVTVSKSR